RVQGHLVQPSMILAATTSIIQTLIFFMAFKFKQLEIDQSPQITFQRARLHGAKNLKINHYTIQTEIYTSMPWQVPSLGHIIIWILTQPTKIFLGILSYA